MQAAAKAYFGVDVGQLTPGQSGCGLDHPGAQPVRPDRQGHLALLKARGAISPTAMVVTHTLTRRSGRVVFPKFPSRGAVAEPVRRATRPTSSPRCARVAGRGLTGDQSTTVATGRHHAGQQAQESALAAVAKEFPKTKNKGVRVGLGACSRRPARSWRCTAKDFLEGPLRAGECATTRSSRAPR